MTLDELKCGYARHRCLPGWAIYSEPNFPYAVFKFLPHVLVTPDRRLSVEVVLRLFCNRRYSHSDQRGPPILISTVWPSGRAPAASL